MQPENQPADQPVPTPDERLAALTEDEKIQLVSGNGMWRTHSVPRLGVASVVMADGPNGLRFSREQAADGPEAGADFADFISLVTRRGEAAAAERGPEPATCFPTASTVGTSWDPELARALGDAFAAECRSFGVGVLLGPGMNIRRTPLAGRTSEYYSEDPLLTGVMAAGVTRGLQERGVGACIKHFAANNSEIERTSMDSIIDERALRDIYLRAFERVVRDAEPWAVMSSYNRLNGTQAAQHPWLLTQVLRDEWGYDGLVVSDWHGITDRPASVLAGNDLDMPESPQRIARLRAGVHSGAVPGSALDRAASRVLQLADRASTHASEPVPFDTGAHHDLARRIARAGTVLLANNGTLPLDADSTTDVLVLGAGAAEPVIQGFGSARMRPTRVDVPLTEIEQRAGGAVRHLAGVPAGAHTEDERRAALREATEAAARSGVAIVFAHTPQNSDGENADRADLSLDAGYDELIAAVAAAAPRTVVVLTVPDAVTMPWLSDVDAVLVPFYAGQGMGSAVASLLFGEDSPAGKLTTTFPQRLADVPAFLGYPGEGGRHVYVEGALVGYRGYDERDTAPLFPFGFGLSYTTFALSEVTVDRDTLSDGESLTVSVRVRNTGARAGAEVVQVYARPERPRVRSGPRELVGFARVELAPDEERTVTIPVTADDLAHWDVTRARRVLDDGPLHLLVGTSSRDLPHDVTVTVRTDVPRWKPLRRHTAPAAALGNPVARRAVAGLLARHLDVDADTADGLLQECRRSFVNVFDTVANRFRLVLDETEIAQVIDQVAADEEVLHPVV
ncbi:beta-glucosidase family protein [Streptomyces sp. CRN 30]|uniref:beta-glucosidase family protein n=1 Tax=Streptomyces sp. CRN 30 TaxID=3075613 RepID=UPI002A820E5A|nr:glycoside hydrolase family 3 C-terminal domain-containing protein [Streptomyces sp. CRN 30]